MSAEAPDPAARDAADSAARDAGKLRLLAFGGTLVIVAVAALVAGFRPSPERIRDWGDGLGAAGPVAFVPLSTALGCLLVPGPALAASAGLLFGTALGTPLALAAATATAVTQLTIGRRLAGERLRDSLPPRIRRLDTFIERRGFLAVLYVRLAPAIPYHLVNYGAGLTRLRARDMAAGTAVGAAPRTFAYVALGGSLGNLGAPEAKIALGVGVAMAIVGLLVGRRQLAAERAAEGR